MKPDRGLTPKVATVQDENEVGGNEVASAAAERVGLLQVVTNAVPQKREDGNTIAHPVIGDSKQQGRHNAPASAERACPLTVDSRTR